jgi:sortase A
MKLRRIISWVVSFTMVGAGLLLIGFFFLGGTFPTLSSSDGEGSGGFNVPEVQSSSGVDDGGPEDKTLTLDVPGMERIEADEIPTARGDDHDALRENAGIHLDGTGFPWQEESNVYIAGHRLGYPASGSFLAFYDQQNLEEGDEIFVTDSEGAKYTYRVFDEFVTDGSDLSVTEPVEGKNILTLQTCTLPDYSDRIITQAELVEVVEA